MRRIFPKVGIQQIKRHAPHGNLPDHSLYVLRRSGYGDMDFTVLSIANFFKGKMINIRLGILLLLPAVLADVLMKIPLAVKKTYPHQGKPQGGSRLEMIACKNSQAPRKNGKGFVDSELHGKIGNGPFTAIFRFISIRNRCVYPSLKKCLYTSLVIQKTGIR